MINTIIAIILFVWFLVWVRKNFARTSPKEYFQKLLDSSELGFAKLEFELFGLKEEREEFRKEFDRQNEYLEAFKAQAENPANTKETIEQFQQKITECAGIIENLKDRINQKDVEIKATLETKEDLHRQMRNLVAYIDRQ